MSTLDNLLHITEIVTEDEVITKIDSILPLIELIDSLDDTDILYKLSASSGIVLQSLAGKVASIKLLEVEDEEVDDYFNEDEKAFIYGCYLLASKAKQV